MGHLLYGIWLAILCALGGSAIVLFILDGRSVRADTVWFLFVTGVLVTTIAHAVAPAVRRRFARFFAKPS
jgi:ABC-type enterochelin transport system permease subunit